MGDIKEDVRKIYFLKKIWKKQLSIIMQKGKCDTCNAMCDPEWCYFIYAKVAFRPCSRNMYSLEEAREYALIEYKQMFGEDDLFEVLL